MTLLRESCLYQIWLALLSILQHQRRTPLSDGRRCLVQSPD